MVYPQNRAQQRTGVRSRSEPRQTAMAGLGGGPFPPHEGRGDLVLAAQDQRIIDGLRELCEQGWQEPRHDLQDLRSDIDHQIVRSRWEHKDGYQQANNTTYRDLYHAFKRGRERSRMGDG